MIKMRFDMDANQKRTYDNEICNQLEQIVETNKCKVVHAYIPMAAEIDIKPLLQKMLDRKVTVVCPKALPKRKLENRVLKSFNELETGVMGTQHPLERDIYSGQYDLIIVPGLAFDDKLYRVGYGGGYYDGFLSENKNAMKVGIFYPFQKMESIPLEPHDVKMDKVIYSPVL